VFYVVFNEHSIDMELARSKRHPIAKQSWAADQIESTIDFCPQSTLWFYASLHLSMQIEHHLFPSLNHCHLQLIQPVVEETCKEYNVNYKIIIVLEKLIMKRCHISIALGILHPPKTAPL
jgi:fatty acid desaturase